MEIAKKCLNILWGALCQKNEISMTFDIDTKDDINIKNEILEIWTSGKKIHVKFVKGVRYFETNFGRIGPFLLARGRRMASKMMEPHLEHIVRVHTDGFISRVPLKFKKMNASLDSVNIGSNMGDLKYVGYYPTLTIHNCISVRDENGNKVIWVKE